MGCNATLHLLLPETQPGEVERGWEPGQGWGARSRCPLGTVASLPGRPRQGNSGRGGGEGAVLRGGAPGSGGQAAMEEQLQAPGSRGGWSATLLVVPRPP